MVTNNLEVVKPHAAWPLTASPAALHPYMADNPLQQACSFFSGALGGEELDPYLALTLLISAAAVGTSGSQGPAASLIPVSNDQVS